MRWSCRARHLVLFASKSWPPIPAASNECSSRWHQGALANDRHGHHTSRCSCDRRGLFAPVGSTPHSAEQCCDGPFGLVVLALEHFAGWLEAPPECWAAR
eukprot:11703784-Alexandrium_andersonii.AAC.1